MDNDVDDNDIKGTSDILIVCNLLFCYHFYYFLLLLLPVMSITHREITISGVVPKLESYKTTPSLTRSFERRSLFGAQSGCIG